jgi:hypothetical protein
MLPEAEMDAAHKLRLFRRRPVNGPVTCGVMGELEREREKGILGVEKGKAQCQSKKANRGINESARIFHLRGNDLLSIVPFADHLPPFSFVAFAAVHKTTYTIKNGKSKKRKPVLYETIGFC